MLKDFLIIAFPSLYIINLFFAIFIIVFQLKKPASTWSWLIITMLIPFGFLLYLILGLEGRRYKVFQQKALNDEKLFSAFYEGRREVINKQLSLIKSMDKITDCCRHFDRLAVLNLIGGNAPLSSLYSLKIYSRGKDKFSSLFKAIENAKDFIFIEYYIIREDSLGNALKTLLIKKANEGVNIFLLYDGMGNAFNSKEFLAFENIKNIKVSVFLPPKFIRLNYRCHRKLCIIDNSLAYLGGFNIGTEYIGQSEKFGFWRDCHISFKGNAVTELALRFIADFNYFSSFKLSTSILANSTALANNPHNPIPVQIVSGGPDCRYDNILNCFYKLISSAKDSIFIETPYFVPDESIIEALKSAALGGIDVKIIIPAHPDHPFVYWASLSYLGELLSSGVKCYGYTKGFLHSKLIICDSFATSVGTANLDLRSLRLNFETTAIIYDTAASESFNNIFKSDLLSSKEITLDAYVNRGFLIKLKEGFSRLLSNLL